MANKINIENKTMKTGNKTSHGGKRPGSGRPKADTKQLNIRLSMAALNKLLLDAERQGISKAQVVERLILSN